jgi:hypothetical protein
MTASKSALSGWTPEKIAEGKLWIETWRQAGPILERIRRDELRRVGSHTIGYLCGPANYRVPPRAPKPWSGLVDQQRWFMKLRDGD